MRVTSLLLACAVLFSTDVLAAQSPHAPDPISGTWTGHMGPEEAAYRHQITLTLKLDGVAVTGTITGPPRPGTIRTGTFDPATGSLKFEVLVQDDANTIAVFDGKVNNGTAAGRVSLDNQNGVFRLSKMAGGSTAAAGQGAVDAAAAVRGRFDEVSAYVIKAANLVPADKYTYRPTESVRTVGQQIAHIADGYTYFCATASDRKVQWSEATEKGPLDKATLVQKLKQATDACAAPYSGTGHIGPLLQNVTHTNLHYGNIVTYMRMLGLIPPSS